MNANKIPDEGSTVDSQDTKLTAACGCAILVSPPYAPRTQIPEALPSVVTPDGKTFHYKQSHTCEQHTGYGGETVNNRLGVVKRLLLTLIEHDTPPTDDDAPRHSTG